MIINKLLFFICIISVLAIVSCSFESPLTIPAEPSETDGTEMDLARTISNLPITIDVEAGKAYYHSFALSGFASGIYLFSLSSSGTLPIANLTVSALPGVILNGKQGFYGPSSTGYLSFIVLSSAVKGQLKNITINIYNLSGQLVDKKTVKIQIPAPSINKGCSLSSGGVLYINEYLQSTDGKYILIMQSDGNLVLYQVSPSWKALWASGTWNKLVTKCELTDTGNLRVVGVNSIYWQSNSSTIKDRAVFYVQEDGNLVIYQTYPWKAVWDRW